MDETPVTGRSAFRRIRAVTVLLLMLFLCRGTGAAFPAEGDLPAGAKGAKAVVLLFVARDCPVSNAYAPEIKRLCARYGPRKVTFFLVYPEPDLALAEAKRHAGAFFGPRCPVLLDPGRRRARRTGVTVTPEAAVLNRDGRLLYRGRIDDRYVDWGKRRDRATKHDLRDALEAVLKDKPVPNPATRAVGCFICNGKRAGT